MLALVIVSIAHGRAGHADWQVKRRGSDALMTHGLATLEANPDQPALAARIVRLAGKAELAAALDGLKRAADRAPKKYEPRQAFAQLLLAAGRAGEAAEAFAMAAKLRPGSGAAAGGLARALALAGRRDEAFAAYDEALGREHAAAARSSLLRSLLGFAARVGALEREIAARRELQKLEPGNERAAIELADALKRSGRPAEGAAVLEAMLGSGRRKAALLKEIAVLHETAGDDEAAQRRLTESLAETRGESERADLYDRLIRIARRRDSLPALAALLGKRVEGAGARMRAEWQALARVREDLGDLDGALAAAQRATALDPGNQAQWRDLVALLDRLGRETELMAAYDQIGRRWPEDSSFALERIERKFRFGERDEARALFDKALRTFRRDGDALAKLADLASRWTEDDRVLSAWDAVLALAPHDERAIVGLGEAHFQRGRRELARRTWRLLLGAVKPRPEAHARLAELLGDHDLLDEAVAEARTAQKVDPQNPHHHRTLARILERKKDFAGALQEWRTVLAMSVGPARAGDRREARSSLIGLLQREGRSRLDLEAVKLQEHLGRQPDDKETTVFLAEVEQRRLDPDRAVATLRAAAKRWPDDPDVLGALVRLLRQSRQLGEAVERLETLAAKNPDRARDAYLQIAEIDLSRYADQHALEYADKAAKLSQDDPEALTRIGEIEERAGQTERAMATYRRALARGTAAKAAAALVRLLLRQGGGVEASEALTRFAVATSDDDARAELLGKEIDLAEYLGRLPELERVLLALPTRTASSRKLAMALLSRMVPSLYRAGDAEAPSLERLSRWALRPALEIATDSDADPDPSLVELLGMLGNRHATPVLMRLAQPLPGKTRAGAGPRSAVLPIAATIALGRLGDDQASAVLRGLAGSPDAGVRVVALWALGRTRNPNHQPLLQEALADPRPEIAAVAALGLGRMRGRQGVPALKQVAADLGRPPRVRRAAALGLGLAEDADGAATLVSMLDAPDPTLAQAAATGLGAIKDRRTLPALWSRVLLGRGPSQGAALAALRSFAAPAGLSDEARALREVRFDVDLLLDAIAATPVASAGELEGLWTEHAADIQRLLAGALRMTGEPRRRALLTLDGRDDGVDLGPLGGIPSEAGKAALRTLGAELRDGVAAGLDDADPLVRRMALRVASKLHDARPGVWHIQSAIAAAPPTEQRGVPTDAEPTALLAARAQLESGRLTPATLADSLRPLLADGSWERRLTAVRVLRLAGPAAATEIRRAAADPNPFVRAEAATAVIPAAR